MLIETPIILFVSWHVSRWSVRRFEVAPAAAARFVMGAVALALLLLAEAALSVAVFGRSIAEHVAAYRSPPALIGLAAQFAFAAMPYLQARNARAPA